MGDGHGGTNNDVNNYSSGVIHYEGITEDTDCPPLMADSGIVNENETEFKTPDEHETVYDIRETLFRTHEDFIYVRSDGERVLRLRARDAYHKANIEVTSNRGIIIDVRYAGEDPENISSDYPARLIEHAEPRTTPYSDLHKEELERGSAHESVDINESRWAVTQFGKHMARYWERETIDTTEITEIPHVQQHPGPQKSMLTVITGIGQEDGNPYATISFERDANAEDLKSYAAHARRAAHGNTFVRRYYQMSYRIDPIFGMLQCVIEQGFTDRERNTHKTYTKMRYITSEDESDFRTFLYSQHLQ